MERQSSSMEWEALFQQSTDLVIETDASRQGWGAYCQWMSTGGRWLPEETSYHINCLELLAGSLAIMSFTKNKAMAQVLLLMDKVSAVTYIDKMGGTHSPMLSYLAKNLWDWCLTHNRDLKQPGRVCGRPREKTSEVWVENVVQSGKNKCLSKLPSRLVAEVGRLH